MMPQLKLEARKSGMSPAFSLLELLIVMGVILLLAALALPAVTQILRASKLSASGRMVVDQLNFARQTALTLNLPVEVRFYKIAERDGAGGASAWRAIRLFVIDDGEATPLTKAGRFPAPVVISEKALESSFISLPPGGERSPQSGESDLPGYGGKYKYAAFRFHPSGEPNLTGGNNHLTLVLENDPPLSEGANFMTVQINPVNGTIGTYRP